MFDMQSQKDRALMNRAVRSFFDSRGFQEVFTPTLSPYLIPEPTIQDFKTRFVNEFEGSRDLYLIPSPEVFMKELLASGSPSLYQISQCFRNSEQLGIHHNPEFTMLEWYALGESAGGNIKTTEELVHSLADALHSPAWLKEPFKVVSVRDAVMERTGLDLEKLQDPEDLAEAARSVGESPAPGEAWDDIFNRIFISHVETALPKEGAVVFTGYPEQIECLAIKDGCWRRRWELYLGGVEVANCYEEETSPEATKDYFMKEGGRMKAEREGTDLPAPPAWEGFTSLAVPRSSGVAAGMDRLLMALTGRRGIEEVLLFPFKELLGRQVH